MARKDIFEKTMEILKMKSEDDTKEERHTCARAVAQELRNSLELEDDFVEELDKNKRAYYSITIGGIKGEVIISETNDDNDDFCEIE